MEFVQIYVFVREHQHSIPDVIKKERSSLSYKFCRGLVVIFFAKRRQFSWSFHSGFFLFLSYFLFLLEGRLWKRRNSKRFSFLFSLKYILFTLEIISDPSEFISYGIGNHFRPIGIRFLSIFGLFLYIHLFDCSRRFRSTSAAMVGAKRWKE